MAAVVSYVNSAACAPVVSAMLLHPETSRINISRVEVLTYYRNSDASPADCQMAVINAFRDQFGAIIIERCNSGHMCLTLVDERSQTTITRLIQRINSVDFPPIMDKFDCLLTVL